MAEISPEEKAFQVHRQSFPWLELCTAPDDEKRLGCRICRAHSQGGKGFSAGQYKIGQYFYARTLTQHEESRVHIASVKKAEDPAPSTPRPQESPARPVSPGLEGSPGNESKASSPRSPGDKPKDTFARFRNMLAGAYLVIRQENSAASFRSHMEFARMTGGLVPSAHDSESIFAECRNLIADTVMAQFTADVKASPYFAVSIDEKDRFLIVIISFFRKGERVTQPVWYRDLPGFEASDLFKTVQSLLQSLELDPGFLVGFTADGASVMGTRRACGACGENVAAKLQEWCGHPLLITHCAPHRLQLCVSSSFKDPYLQDLAAKIKALYKNISDHPGAVIDLVFWSDVANEDVLPSLQTSAARWLSILGPVRKLLKSYVTVLSHLMYIFQHHTKNKDQKKTVMWLFQTFATWECRLTLAGVQDILDLCFAYKNRLEAVSSFNAVQDIADAFHAELDTFCRKNSVLAAAMAGDTPLPGGGALIEQLCDQYRREVGKKLHLVYTAKGQIFEEWVDLKAVPNRDAMKTMFQRLGDFARECQGQVLERFACRAIWTHARIFRPDYVLSQESFQNAVWSMGDHLKLDNETLLREMRSAWAVRDAILKREEIKKTELLWSKVLQALQERKDCCLAQLLISAFLLSPSQAATCERGFATIVRLKTALSEATPQVLEQYLQICGLSESLPDAIQNGTLKSMTAKFLEKNRLLKSTEAAGFRRKGRMVIQRKRAERSDSGKSRPKYKARKKHDGLREQPNARLLSRTDDAKAEIAEAPAEAAAHDIWQEFTPPRRK